MVRKAVRTLSAIEAQFQKIEDKEEKLKQFYEPQECSTTGGGRPLSSKHRYSHLLEVGDDVSTLMTVDDPLAAEMLRRSRTKGRRCARPGSAPAKSASSKTEANALHVVVEGALEAMQRPMSAAPSQSSMVSSNLLNAFMKQSYLSPRAEEEAAKGSPAGRPPTGRASPSRAVGEGHDSRGQPEHLSVPPLTLPLIAEDSVYENDADPQHPLPEVPESDSQRASLTSESMLLYFGHSKPHLRNRSPPKRGHSAPHTRSPAPLRQLAAELASGFGMGQFPHELAEGRGQRARPMSGRPPMPKAMTSRPMASRPTSATMPLRRNSTGAPGQPLTPYISGGGLMRLQSFGSESAQAQSESGTTASAALLIIPHVLHSTCSRHPPASLPHFLLITRSSPPHHPLRSQSFGSESAQALSESRTTAPAALLIIPHSFGSDSAQGQSKSGTTAPARPRSPRRANRTSNGFVNRDPAGPSIATSKSIRPMSSKLAAMSEQTAAAFAIEKFQQIQASAVTSRIDTGTSSPERIKQLLLEASKGGTYDLSEGHLLQLQRQLEKVDAEGGSKTPITLEALLSQIDSTPLTNDASGVTIASGTVSAAKTVYGEPVKALEEDFDNLSDIYAPSSADGTSGMGHAPAAAHRRAGLRSSALEKSRRSAYSEISTFGAMHIPIPAQQASRAPYTAEDEAGTASASTSEQQSPAAARRVKIATQSINIRINEQLGEYAHPADEPSRTPSGDLSQVAESSEADLSSSSPHLGIRSVSVRPAGNSVKPGGASQSVRSPLSNSSGPQSFPAFTALPRPSSASIRRRSSGSGNPVLGLPAEPGGATSARVPDLVKVSVDTLSGSVSRSVPSTPTKISMDDDYLADEGVYNDDGDDDNCGAMLDEAFAEPASPQGRGRNSGGAILSLHADKRVYNDDGDDDDCGAMLDEAFAEPASPQGRGRNSGGAILSLHADKRVYNDDGDDDDCGAMLDEAFAEPVSPQGWGRNSEEMPTFVAPTPLHLLGAKQKPCGAAPRLAVETSEEPQPQRKGILVRSQSLSKERSVEIHVAPPTEDEEELDHSGSLQGWLFNLYITDLGESGSQLGIKHCVATAVPADDLKCILVPVPNPDKSSPYPTIMGPGGIPVRSPDISVAELLPWVEYPSQLYEHWVRVEAFAVVPTASKMLDAFVFMGDPEYEVPPFPDLRKMTINKYTPGTVMTPRPDRRGLIPSTDQSNITSPKSPPPPSPTGRRSASDHIPRPSYSLRSPRESLSSSGSVSRSVTRTSATIARASSLTSPSSSIGPSAAELKLGSMILRSSSGDRGQEPTSGPGCPSCMRTSGSARSSASGPGSPSSLKHSESRLGPFRPGSPSSPSKHSESRLGSLGPGSPSSPTKHSESRLGSFASSRRSGSGRSVGSGSGVIITPGMGLDLEGGIAGSPLGRDSRLGSLRRTGDPGSWPGSGSWAGRQTTSLAGSSPSASRDLGLSGLGSRLREITSSPPSSPLAQSSTTRGASTEDLELGMDRALAQATGSGTNHEGAEDARAGTKHEGTEDPGPGTEHEGTLDPGADTLQKGTNAPGLGPELSALGLGPKLSASGLGPELSALGLGPNLSAPGLCTELSALGLGRRGNLESAFAAEPMLVGEDVSHAKMEVKTGLERLSSFGPAKPASSSIDFTEAEVETGLERQSSFGPALTEPSAFDLGQGFGALRVEVGQDPATPDTSFSFAAVSRHDDVAGDVRSRTPSIPRAFGSMPPARSDDRQGAAHSLNPALTSPGHSAPWHLQRLMREWAHNILSALP
eukprot:gene14397-20399_t